MTLLAILGWVDIPWSEFVEWNRPVPPPAKAGPSPRYRRRKKAIRVSPIERDSYMREGYWFDRRLLDWPEAARDSKPHYGLFETLWAWERDR